MLFGLSRPLHIEAHLRAASSSLSAGVDAAALDASVVARTVDDSQARIAVHVPAAGEYTLEVYTCDPQRDGDLFSLSWQYLLRADTSSPVRSDFLKNMSLVSLVNLFLLEILTSLFLVLLCHSLKWCLRCYSFCACLGMTFGQ